MIPFAPHQLRRLVETQIAASEVIARRVGLMWLAPFDAATQRETFRMIAEKQTAAAEAAIAFTAAMAEEMWRFWLVAPFRPPGPFPVEKALSGAIGRAATPVTRRVKANRRRLRP